jgi:hypothetical protein
VEFDRNNKLHESIMGIMKVVSNVTEITEWKYNYFKGDDSRDLNTENLA